MCTGNSSQIKVIFQFLSYATFLYTCTGTSTSSYCKVQCHWEQLNWHWPTRGGGGLYPFPFKFQRIEKIMIKQDKNIRKWKTKERQLYNIWLLGLYMFITWKNIQKYSFHHHHYPPFVSSTPPLKFLDPRLTVEVLQTDEIAITEAGWLNNDLILLLKNAISAKHRFFVFLHRQWRPLCISAISGMWNNILSINQTLR